MVWHFIAEDGHEDYALDERERCYIRQLYIAANILFVEKEEEAMEENSVIVSSWQEK